MKVVLVCFVVAIMAVGVGFWLGKYTSKPTGVVNLSVPGKVMDGANARKIIISSRGNHIDVICNSSCPDLNAHVEVRDSGYRIGVYNQRNGCIYCGDMYVDGGAQFDDRVVKSGNGLKDERVHTAFDGEGWR